MSNSLIRGGQRGTTGPALQPARTPSGWGYGHTCGTAEAFCSHSIKIVAEDWSLFFFFLNMHQALVPCVTSSLQQELELRYTSCHTPISSTISLRIWLTGADISNPIHTCNTVSVLIHHQASRAQFILEFKKVLEMS